jgi:hypothetical protein
MTTWEETSSLRRGQTALRDAMVRLHLANDAQDGDRFFAAAVEASMWAVAMDDFLKDEDASYASRRDADPAGQIVLGLRWARNQGIHNLMSVHRMESGRTYPRVYPMTYEVIAKWLPRNLVPKELKLPQKANKENYDAAIVGTNVLDTLERAREFFWIRAIPSRFDPLP